MFNKTKPKTIESKNVKEERFKRIATRRVQETLNKLRLLKNCANTSNYSYTDEQARKIINTIDDEWKKVKMEFNKNKPKGEEFRL